jgi:RNA-directed DNA polymerase
MGSEESEAAIVPKKRGNAHGGKGCRELIFQRREMHIVHRDEEDAYTKLQRIAELAKQDKKVKFTSLAHLLTPGFLGENFMKLNQKASPGSDGVTMEEYKKGFDANIEELWMELKSGKYRAVPVRRRYIQKPDGRQRPLGIPTVKDRIVQRAVSEIVSAVYEPYFCDFSYGFRPGRSAHQALECLRKFLRHRIADNRLLQIIGKWLKAGFMDNGVKDSNHRDWQEIQFEWYQGSWRTQNL